MSHLPISEFADKISTLMPLLAKEFARLQVNELYKGKITLHQCLIMDFLHKQGESRMTDIASFMRVSTADMTGVVERLVKYGLAVRIFDPNDRRIIKISLTPKGVGLIKKVNQQKRQAIIRIFGQISEREREDYLKILMHIHEILIKEEGAQR